MTLTDETREAIAWRLRLRDAAAEDWIAFTRWLELDPRRQPAYERVALFDEEASRLPAPDQRPEG
jgi:ferric-dicitrate binding protein FerR (iron transport regulator)